MAEPKTLRLGDTAPDFAAETTHGTFASFHKWIGDSWCILFSHPEDYTPVCTTELGAVAQLHTEWQKRNCKVIGLSCNGLGSHHAWLKDIEELARCPVQFPLICDQDRRISALYNMLDSAHHDPTNIDQSTGMPFTVRTVFILDPKKTIRLMITYPASCGRNFDEILRTLDSLQLTDAKGVSTPVNWRPGQECIVPPTVPLADAQRKFHHVRVVKPYLRFAKL